MKKIIFRIIIVILLGITCGGIFYFSHQPADKSDNTSGEVIKVIINTFSYTRNLDQHQKKILQDRMQPIIRKLAHFSIYTIVGVLIMTFSSTFDWRLINKLSVSIGFGIIYAISDEIHQYFIPGRSCQITDVLIDLLGIVFGITFVTIINKYNKINKEE